MTGEHRLSLEAIINAALMAHVNSKAPAQEQPESACWGRQDPACLPGSKSQARANAQEAKMAETYILKATFEEQCTYLCNI